MAGRITRPSTGQVLFKKRIGGSLIRSGWHTGMRLNKAKFSWPLGKLSLFRDRLEIKGLLLPTVTLQFDEIDIIRSSLLRVMVEHDNEDVPDYVALTGWGLSGAVRDAVRRNNLPVKVSL